MNRFVDKVASLIPAVRRIMCQGATEYPHTGAYNSGFADGSYLCRRCGLALLRANNQFNAGCGWPSFYEALDKTKVIERKDFSLGMERIEIICAKCGGHLGHVFDDGPKPTGLRYCMNGTALIFIPDSPTEKTP